MKADTTHEVSSSVYLAGTILFANLDISGLTDYAVKAVIGGAIWFGYKLAADYFERKRKTKQQ